MKRPVHLLTAIAALGVGLLVGLWFERWDPQQPWLVDAQQSLGVDGATFAFTLAEPAEVEIELTLPEGAVARVFAILPKRDPDLSFIPSVRPIEITAAASGVPGKHHLAAAGPWVIRVEPVPTAMGGMPSVVRARVRRR